MYALPHHPKKSADQSLLYHFLTPQPFVTLPIIHRYFKILIMPCLHIMADYLHITTGVCIITYTTLSLIA